MITTIQLHENVKRDLDKLKESQKETYEEIILRLMRAVEYQRRKQVSLMIEGCREMAGESLNIAREFEAIEGDLEKEWQN